MLLTARELDRELKSIHTITIVCQDSGHPIISRRVNIVVHLDDLNDSSPTFTQSVYTVLIAEGVPSNTPIIKVQASDADVGRHSIVQYSLHGNAGDIEIVKIDAQTGLLSSATVFDRETLESINLTVIAKDCPTENSLVSSAPQQAQDNVCSVQNSATAGIFVFIQDVNDNAPEFEQQNYHFSIDEGQRIQQFVGSVHAVDADVDSNNNRIKYSIIEGDVQENIRPSTMFTITSNGEIYTKNIVIERDKTPIFTFSILATDFGTPPLSAYATVIIRVEDVNDHTPTWIFPQPSVNAVASVNVSHHSTVGQVVAHLKAVDEDRGVFGEVEYFITKGNEQDYFALEENSGTLYLAKPFKLTTPHQPAALKNESEPRLVELHHYPQSFVLAVKASDKGDPPRSNTTILRVNVIQYEYPPEWHFRREAQVAEVLKAKTSGRHKVNDQNLLYNSVADRDLIIITSMIAIALIISFALIAAIVCLRCHQTGVRRSVVYTEDVVDNSDCLRQFRRLYGFDCFSTEPEGKNATGFVLRDVECNIDFQEEPHYGSTKETPAHQVCKVLRSFPDQYGGASSNLLMTDTTYSPTTSHIPNLQECSDLHNCMVCTNPSFSPTDQEYIAYTSRMPVKEGSLFAAKKPKLQLYSGLLSHSPSSKRHNDTEDTTENKSTPHGLHYATFHQERSQPPESCKLVPSAGIGILCENRNASDWNELKNCPYVNRSIQHKWVLIPNKTSTSRSNIEADLDNLEMNSSSIDRQRKRCRFKSPSINQSDVAYTNDPAYNNKDDRGYSMLRISTEEPTAMENEIALDTLA